MSASSLILDATTTEERVRPDTSSSTDHSAQGVFYGSAADYYHKGLGAYSLLYSLIATSIRHYSLATHQHTPPSSVPVPHAAVVPYPHRRARSSPALPVPRTQKRRRIRRALCVRGSQSASASTAMHSSKCVRVVLRRPVTSRQVGIPPGSLPRPCAPSRVPRLCRVQRRLSFAPAQVGTYGGPSPSPIAIGANSHDARSGERRAADHALARWNSALTPSFASSRGCCLLSRCVEAHPSPVLPSTAPERGVRRRETNQIRVDTCKNESVSKNVPLVNA
ncbi:hypothetical protein C8R43DRAFT_530819 [Mycena crocata]|nr:hypothetical protein C8R43DRAFT_530819 [Mycena crocata]